MRSGIKKWPVIFGEDSLVFHPHKEIICGWLDLYDKQRNSALDTIFNLNPSVPAASIVGAMACAQYYLGETDNSIELLEYWIEKYSDPDIENIYIRSLFTSCSTTRDQFLSACIRWSEKYECAADTHPTFSKPELSKKQKIKIGLICSYVNSIPFIHSLAPILRQIDRSHIHVTLFNASGEPTRSDVNTYADLVVDSPVVTESLVELIRSQGIDLLLDINGRMKVNNPLEVVLARPAPVQNSWANMLCTYGLKSAPYLFGDKYDIPESHSEFFTGKIKRFKPNVMGCFEIPDSPKKDPLFSRETRSRSLRLTPFSR